MGNFDDGKVSKTPSVELSLGNHASVPEGSHLFKILSRDFVHYPEYPAVIDRPIESAPRARRWRP